MKLNITIERAKEFVKTGKVALVVLRKERECIRASPEDFLVVYSQKDKTVTTTNRYLGIVKINEAGTKYPYIIKVGSVRALCNKGKKIYWCDVCKMFYGKHTVHAIDKKPLRFTVESIEEKHAFGKEYWVIKGKVKG